MSPSILNSRNWKYLLISVIAVAGLLIMLSAYFMSDRMINRYGPLVDAAMEIKLEATTAHLWFEEILSGDSSEEIDTVYEHIDQSLWYANAMLMGGKNPEGEYLPLKDESLKKEIALVIEKLLEFKNLTIERYSYSRELSKAGSEIDRNYDRVFKSFIRYADNVETLLQQKIKSENTFYKTLQVSLTLLILLLSGLIMYMQLRFDHSMEESQRKLLESNHLKDEFVATASHELRSPLAVLSGYSELLMQNTELPDDVKKNCYKSIYKKTYTLNRIVEELLDVSRLESGRLIQLERDDVIIFEVAKDVVDEFKGENDVLDISLSFDDESVMLNA
jgi:signal transduction histidine kinase